MIRPAERFAVNIVHDEPDCVGRSPRLVVPAHDLVGPRRDPRRRHRRPPACGLGAGTLPIGCSSRRSRRRPRPRSSRRPALRPGPCRRAGTGPGLLRAGAARRHPGHHAARARHASVDACHAQRRAAGSPRPAKPRRARQVDAAGARLACTAGAGAAAGGSPEARSPCSAPICSTGLRSSQRRRAATAAERTLSARLPVRPRSHSI